MEVTDRRRVYRQAERVRAVNTVVPDRDVFRGRACAYPPPYPLQPTEIFDDAIFAVLLIFLSEHQNLGIH